MSGAATDHSRKEPSSHERGAPDGTLLPMGELPGALREIAEVIGVAAALRLAELRGGTRLSIPGRVTADCWLALAIGEDKARALSEHFTSGYTAQTVEIPLGPTGARAELARRVGELLENGMSRAQIARQLRISERTVRRHRARTRPKVARARTDRT